MIAFWDCNTNKSLFSLSAHLSPATGLAFSPINDTLAVSVGLDKKWVCCDTKTKKQIMSIQSEFPLTSVDFDQDGISIAVGSSRGRLLVYDLRSQKKPIHDIAGHNSSVTSVVYKPKQTTAPNNPTSGVTSASKTRSSRLSHQKSAPSLKTVQEEGKENSDPVVKTEEKDETFTKADEKMFSSVKDESMFPASSNRRESLSSMLFSPLRDSDSSFSSNIGGGSASRDLESRTETGRHSALRRISSDSVFSPLRDSPGPGSANVSAKRTPFTSFSTPPTMSPLTMIKEEARPESGSSLEIESDSRGRDDFDRGVKLSLESLGCFVKETINTTSKSPVFQTAAPTRMDLSHQNTNISHKSPGQENSPVEKPTTPSEFMNVITAFPHLIEARETSNKPPQPDIR